MSEKRYILAIDQGTTRTKSIIFDENGNIVGQGYSKVESIYPRPGWVEQRPKDLLQSILDSTKQALKTGGIDLSRIEAIGMANQGETVIVWDSETGEPVYNAISWQCRRTAPLCEELKRLRIEDKIREKTGLIIDPYFSATKIKWILDNVEEAKRKLKQGKLLCGTSDAWLLWKLSGGEVFVTDYTTASRTMLLNIHKLSWDREILEVLEIPREILPDPQPNSKVVGHTSRKIFGEEIPISGLIVDQQGALFGQACFDSGMVKCTYGTGCFILMNTGEKPVLSKHGLLTTVAWKLDGNANYALDGGIFIAGAAIEWLKRIGLIRDAAETERLARSIKDTGDLFFIPAFAGLAAPYWDPYARGTIVGITGGTGREHIVRALLEAIAFRVHDIINCMEIDSGYKIKTLRVDGGMVANKFLMEFQADILGIPIEVPKVSETTSLGVAYLAGLATHVWRDLREIADNWEVKEVYKPKLSEERRKILLERWKEAVKRSLKWSKM